MERAGKILQRIGGQVINYRDVTCPNCGTALGTEREEQDWVDEAEELSWLMDDD